jgi:hypothetical protein
MPYVINWPHKRGIAIAAACLSMLVTASPASASWGSSYQPYQQYQPSAPASSSCPLPASSSVFSTLGDLASYAPLPGGTFEGSADGWALNGASLVPGNEPWYVNSSGDSQSLNIPGGAYAVSPSFCLTSQLPSWRFFAKAAEGSWATKLQVTALWSDLNGNSGQITATSLYGGGYSSWQPTSSLPLGSVLSPGDVVNVRFVFSANNGGAWNIDDVYVDPYAR